MTTKTFYGESKQAQNLYLTKTSIEWLEAERIRLNAVSVSDVIERLARGVKK